MDEIEVLAINPEHPVAQALSVLCYMLSTLMRERGETTLIVSDEEVDKKWMECLFRHTPEGKYVFQLEDPDA